MAATSNLNLDWENYPCNLPQTFCVAEEDSQRQALQNDACRLFSGRDDVDIWEHDYMDNGTAKQAFHTTDSNADMSRQYQEGKVRQSTTQGIEGQYRKTTYHDP